MVPKSPGPTAGTETVDPLEFLARVLVHIPDKGHVTTRYYGIRHSPLNTLYVAPRRSYVMRRIFLPRAQLDHGPCSLPLRSGANVRLPTLSGSGWVALP